MSEVRINDGENFEVALKRFNRKIQQDGILGEARRRSHYESPSIRRKKKAATRLRKNKQNRQRRSS
jgi:small subunit ribosomal protein S21